MNLPSIPYAVALDAVKHGCILIGVGFLVGVGIRAGEWLIPKPELRVLICQANQASKVAACKRLDEMLAAKEDARHAQNR